MRIGFISEYFPPFAPGGAEWSTYYLAQSLAKKGHQIFVITPNFGAKELEEMSGVKIFRFPYKKMTKGQKILPEYYFLNPIWFLWGAWNIYKFARENKIEILHIHGKYSIPPTKIANIFLRKKILATIRDYQIICNYGFCIYNKNKSCDLQEYLTSDFIYYLQNYVNQKKLTNILINLWFALVGRTIKGLLKSFAISEQIIVLSNKQKAIFLTNGFKKVTAINNSTEFPHKLLTFKPRKELLFAGRLTLGKGVQIILDLLPDFFVEYPDFKFIFAGDGSLKQKIIQLAKTEKRIKILGQISHQQLNKLYAKSLLTVVPSIWQEPFGRVPLESIALGTPSVVTHKGGLPEIIKNGRWGYVVKANSGDVLSGIVRGITNNKKLRQNIKNDYPVIRKKFSSSITDKYLNQYKILLKN